MRRDIRTFANIHSHGPVPRQDTVLSVTPDDTIDSEGFYSVGIHPWDTPTTNEALERLETIARENPNVVAIGECGIDRLRGASIEEQERVFEAQIEIAERLGLPLIIHCVRANDILLRIRKSHPAGRWIFHGFRGSPQAARQLLDAGIDLSFGLKYNSEAYTATPPDRRFHETD